MAYGDPYQGQRSPFGSGRIILALIVAAISMISYCSTRTENPITHQTQHIALNVDQEIALGLHAAPEMSAQYGGQAHDGPGQARVSRVGQSIIARSDAQRTPYQYHFTLLADPKTINAFALPGGQIFITEGLYQKLETDGELAGVLGHEIGHVVARHGAQQLAKERLTEGLTGAAVIASSDPNNPNSNRNAAIAMAVSKLVTLKYGRNDELEADRLGVQFMSAAGYDPRSMLKVMQILEQASQGHAPPEFFSTHPNPEHRGERIQQAIARQFPDGVPSGMTP